MFGYIYKTVIYNPKSSLHQHFYIGQKQSNVFLDYYFGSGKKLRDYFNAHCKRKWSRHIYKEEAELLGLRCEMLASAENIDALNKLEEYYVNKELNNPMCMNLMTGGLGRTVKREVIESMAQTKRNRQYKWWTNGKTIKMSQECPGEGFVRGKYIDGYNWYTNGEHNVYSQERPIGFRLGTKPTTAGKIPWNKGHKTPKDVCEKISQRKKGISVCIRTQIKKGEHRSLATEFKKGQVPWNKGQKGILKGNSGSFHGEYKGTKWFNNGIKNIRARTAPNGREWVAGMLIIKKISKIKTKRVNNAS